MQMFSFQQIIIIDVYVYVFISSVSMRFVQQVPTSELILRPKEVIFFSREEYFWQERVFFAGKRRSEKGIFQFESQGDYPACHVLHVGSLHIKVGVD